MGRLRHEVGQRQKQEDSESAACGVVLDTVRMRKSKMYDGMSDSTFESVFIVFLVLKLTNVIDWSWWWVTSPLWIYAALWIFLKSNKDNESEDTHNG